MRSIIVAAVLLCAAMSSVQACEPHEAPCFGDDGSSASGGSWGGGAALAIAGRYKGGNPTGWKYLWCAQFVNHVEKKAGRSGTGSAAARSFFAYGRPASSPRPGDIAVRRNGGHVGYVAAVNGSKFTLRGGNQCGRRGTRTVCDSTQSVSAYTFRRI